MFHSPFTLSSSGLAICVKSNTRFVFLFPGDKSYCLKLKLIKKKKKPKTDPTKQTNKTPTKITAKKLNKDPKVKNTFFKIVLCM